MTIVAFLSEAHSASSMTAEIIKFGRSLETWSPWKFFIEVCVSFHNLLVEVDKRIRKKLLSYTAKPYEIGRVQHNLILYTI